MAAILSERELYCPSHFGNTYETCLDNEMHGILSEAKYWGYNCYSDWFNTIDLRDVYNPENNLYNLPEAIWHRKISNFIIAKQLNYNLGLIVTPNHVFSDQVTDKNKAILKGNFFGQLVCPSKPGVTEMILSNYRSIFRDLAKRDLELYSITGLPYDYGGCACDECCPWIITFLELFKHIVEEARDIFPKISATIGCWWWSDTDYSNFTKWVNNKDAGSFFDSICFHLPYGQFEYEAIEVPEKCEEKAFIHIGYSEEDQYDAYNHYGANIAPVRLEKTSDYLKKRNAKGFLAYSEGNADDINKAVLGGLTSGRFTSANEVIKEYADRYFESDPNGWAELLFAINDFKAIDTKKALMCFDTLAQNAKRSWRLKQIELRIKMAVIDHNIRSQSKWTEKRIEDVRHFLSLKEQLLREVWRLGIQRHCFRIDCLAFMPDWYKDYLAVTCPQSLEDQARFQKLYSLDF